MVTLEQVEQLDERVRKVISLIESLRHENARLFAENRRLLEENQRLEYHLQESERRSLALSGAQEMLEKGLMGAIDRLDSVSSESTAQHENIAAASAKGTANGTAGHVEEDNSDAGLEALLVKDPIAEEMDDQHHNSQEADEQPHLEERKMDIF